MSFSRTQIEEHLSAMGHSATLNKVRYQEALYERAAAKFLLKTKPLEAMRTQPLASVVHDDLNTYALPSDYGTFIDLIPEDNREAWDSAVRNGAGQFDLHKALKNRVISIEGSEGTKIIKINWKSRSPKVLATMDSLTANGTWSAVATASNVAADTITKTKGSGSIRFDVAATNDGIQNTGLATQDMTDENGVADVLFDLYIKNSTDLANLTSITARWGNDLTAKYWTGVAQTLQADGTAFKVGWNTIKVPWSTATQTGTVDATAIDSLKFTCTVSGAISKLRIDNVRFSIGRNFDLKYYSKYFFKVNGAYASRPTTNGDDLFLCDNDSLPLYLFECLKDMAHQLEGTDSAFDIKYARQELQELFPFFRAEYPSQAKKMTSNYGGKPRFQRRW